MTVPAYVILECPECGARRHLEADGASEDVQLRAMSRHVLDAHPETAGADAEALLDDALESPEPVRLDEPPETLDWA